MTRRADDIATEAAIRIAARYARESRRTNRDLLFPGTVEIVKDALYEVAQSSYNRGYAAGRSLKAGDWLGLLIVLGMMDLVFAAIAYGWLP